MIVLVLANSMKLVPVSNYTEILCWHNLFVFSLFWEEYLIQNGQTF